MIFDEHGLPRDTGATDFQDSSRLAGVMAVFRWPQIVNCKRYVDGDGIYWAKKYVRHPFEHIYDFSRDQAICLVAGLFAQGHTELVNIRYVYGKDIFTPAHRGHFERCAGRQSTWLQDVWLWIDVIWNCYAKPMEEPNQLLCMMMVADRKYLNFWTKHNKRWRDSILAYWDNWRGEGPLGKHMISVIEKVIDARQK